jgi:hypothetical protein
VKVTSIAAVIDFAAGKFDVSESLSLDDGRYQVVLKPAQPIDPSSDKEPGPKEVAATGAITHNGQTVGWFEVLGDDTVIIRDADKKIIETHA